MHFPDPRNFVFEVSSFCISIVLSVLLKYFLYPIGANCLRQVVLWPTDFPPDAAELRRRTTTTNTRRRCRRRPVQR